MKKIIQINFFIFFCIFGVAEAVIDTTKYSPALYDQNKNAKKDIQSFLNCQSNQFNQQLSQYWYQLQKKMFGKKITDIEIALDAWLTQFTKKKYQIAFRDLLEGKKVADINQYYNEIDQLTLVANRMGNYLYLKKQQNKTQSCNVSYSKIRNYIAAQYDIGIYWLDLVYQYKGANKYYRGANQAVIKFNTDAKIIEQQKDRLNQIERDE